MTPQHCAVPHRERRKRWSWASPGLRASRSAGLRRWVRGGEVEAVPTPCSVPVVPPSWCHTLLPLPTAGGGGHAPRHHHRQQGECCTPWGLRAVPPGRGSPCPRVTPWWHCLQTHCPVYLVNVSSMAAGDVIAAAKMQGMPGGLRGCAWGMGTCVSPIPTPCPSCREGGVCRDDDSARHADGAALLPPGLVPRRRLRHRAPAAPRHQHLRSPPQPARQVPPPGHLGAPRPHSHTLRALLPKHPVPWLFHC